MPIGAMYETVNRRAISSGVIFAMCQLMSRRLRVSWFVTLTPLYHPNVVLTMRAPVRRRQCAPSMNATIRVGMVGSRRGIFTCSILQVLINGVLGNWESPKKPVSDKTTS